MAHKRPIPASSRRALATRHGASPGDRGVPASCHLCGSGGYVSWFLGKRGRLGYVSFQRLEIDHDTGWATTHTTRVDDANCLCDHHHDLKTYFGWAMVAGTGPREMVPPDDPRHPKNRPK